MESQNSEKQGRLMKVVEIDGNQITATIMNFNPGRGQGMGEMPEGPEGKDGEKPERPEGEVPQDVISENHSGKGEMETVTFTITEETKISQETKSEIIDATLEQIGTDSMIWVELNDNYEAVSIIMLESTQNK